MQVIDDFEPQPVLGVVHRANIGEVVEGPFRRIVQIARNVQQVCGGYGNGGLCTSGVDAGPKDRVRKFRFQVVE